MTNLHWHKKSFYTKSVADFQLWRHRSCIRPFYAQFAFFIEDCFSGKRPHAPTGFLQLFPHMGTGSADTAIVLFHHENENACQRTIHRHRWDLSRARRCRPDQPGISRQLAWFPERRRLGPGGGASLCLCGQ